MLLVRREYEHNLTRYAVSSARVQADSSQDLESARQMVEASLKHHLDDRYEDHAYLVKVCKSTHVPCSELMFRRMRCGVKERATNVNHDHELVATGSIHFP
jgi:hypothetical protein